MFATTHLNIFEQTKQISPESIIKSLLPHGRKEGHEWVALNPTRNDKNFGSFRINLQTGQWIDFATDDKGGDAISLAAYLKGLSQADAAKDILAGCGELVSISPKAPKAPKDDHCHRKIAQDMWNKAQSAHRSLVHRYLQARGYRGTTPLSLRFCERAYHVGGRQNFPAMIAQIIRWNSLETRGIHRTFLAPDGSGKADILNNKMVLGAAKGGAVQLKPLIGDTLVLTEGIETGLSVLQETHLPTWATLSTSGLVNIMLPPSSILKTVIIAADHDEAGLHAAHQLSDRLLLEGHGVKIITPPVQGVDFNDWLQGGVQ